MAWWRVLTVCLVLGLTHTSFPNIKTSARILSGLEDSPLTKVWAVRGGRVLLPCDLSPPYNDSTHLVLFYHNGAGTPIYSLDSRGRSIERGRHWAEAGLGGRAYLQVTRAEHGLVIEDVHIDDEGEYRCRVDFLESPTRNVRVFLTVVVPPRKPSITSNHNPNLKMSGIVGPYPEGEKIAFSCQVLDGRPRPRVTWWHDGSLLDAVSEVQVGHMTRNDLTLQPLTRSDLNKTLTCQAVNSDKMLPVFTSITLDIHYPPTSVRFIDGGTNGVISLAEGVTRPLVCEADGSRPPAHITWWKSGSPILDAKVASEVGGSVSRSTLMLTPESADNAELLICRGFSPTLPDVVLEDFAKLSVLYKPRLELQLGYNLDVTHLREGDDVYFKCLVDANPPVTGIQWAHNGVPVRSEETEGVVVSASSLAIQGVNRVASGVYTCAAANTEGARTSNSVKISVKFSPTCAETQQTIYGAARHEVLHVSCTVDAHPVPTAFRWAVNTSTGLVDVPLNLSHNRGVTSTVRYTPQTHHDFGTLLCWAKNDIGHQKEPCIFHIISAAKPEAVTGCRAERNSSMPASYMVLSCLPGKDGGLNQTFTLEVRQAAREEVLLEFSHEQDPFFIIKGLKIGVEYLLTVTAANSRGSSPPRTINYTATSVSADKVVSSHAHNTLLSITPFLVLLVGVIVVVAVCGSVGMIITKKHISNNNSGAKILYAGPLKDSHDTHNVHTIVSVDKDCEKDKLMAASTGNGAPASIYINHASLFDKCVAAPLETEGLLKERLVPANSLAPMASLDSLGRCSTPSSVCTSSSKTTTSSKSSSSSHPSSTAVAVNSSSVTTEEAEESSSSLLTAMPRESSV